jgi:hypothetical protein
MSLRGEVFLSISATPPEAAWKTNPPISRFDNVEALLKLLVPIQHHPPTL